MQALALLHTVRAAGAQTRRREPERVLRDLSPAADAAYAAGVRAMLAHEAALQRGTATMRCTIPDIWHRPSGWQCACAPRSSQIGCHAWGFEAVV
jgi:hypothetical protein